MIRFLKKKEELEKLINNIDDELELEDKLDESNIYFYDVKSESITKEKIIYPCFVLIEYSNKTEEYISCVDLTFISIKDFSNDNRNEIIN